MYFNGAAAALIVYDVTDNLSFEKARKWVADLVETDANSEQPIIKFLVGNKCDLVDKIMVSAE